MLAAVLQRRGPGDAMPETFQSSETGDEPPDQHKAAHTPWNCAGCGPGGAGEDELRGKDGMLREMYGFPA